MGKKRSALRWLLYLFPRQGGVSRRQAAVLNNLRKLTMEAAGLRETARNMKIIEREDSGTTGEIIGVDWNQTGGIRMRKVGMREL